MGAPEAEAAVTKQLNLCIFALGRDVHCYIHFNRIKRLRALRYQCTQQMGARLAGNHYAGELAAARHVLQPIAFAAPDYRCKRTT